MRPLARKIFLTQGLVILMVFGVSGFAYLSLGSARDRAAALAADYAIGKAHESLGAELRDIERSRSIYFIERRTDGEMMPQLRNSFYESLERVALGVEELAQRAGERDDLGSLIQSLRSQLHTNHEESTEYNQTFPESH